MGDNRAHPDVSVLLVSWNTRSLTEACLASLPGSIAAGLRYEVIAVDNGSTDGSVELLRGLPDVILIENGRTAGTQRRSTRRTRDRPPAGAAAELRHRVQARCAIRSASVPRPDPRAAGVRPRYLNPDGSPQQHHFRLPTMSMLMASSSRVFRALPGFSGSLRRYRMDDDDFSCARQVEQPSASVLLLRRSALPDGWLLDESFPIFFNDVELAWRLRRQGLALWYTPDAEVYHVHGASTRQLGRASPPAPGLARRLSEAHGAAPEPARLHRDDVPPEGGPDACAAAGLAPLPRADPRATGRSRAAPARSVSRAGGGYGPHGITN